MEMKNRRQMMIGTFRYSVLSVVGIFTGSSIIKRRRLIREGKCIQQGICRDCKIYEGCKLPQALSKKQFFIEKNDADRKK